MPYPIDSGVLRFASTDDWLPTNKLILGNCYEFSATNPDHVRFLFSSLSEEEIQQEVAAAIKHENYLRTHDSLMEVDNIDKENRVVTIRSYSKQKTESWADRRSIHELECNDMDETGVYTEEYENVYY